jgi:hypothetical protein
MISFHAKKEPLLKAAAAFIQNTDESDERIQRVRELVAQIPASQNGFYALLERSPVETELVLAELNSQFKCCTKLNILFPCFRGRRSTADQRYHLLEHCLPFADQIFFSFEESDYTPLTDRELQLLIRIPPRKPLISLIGQTSDPNVFMFLRTLKIEKLFLATESKGEISSSAIWSLKLTNAHPLLIEYFNSAPAIQTINLAMLRTPNEIWRALETNKHLKNIHWQGSQHSSRDFARFLAKNKSLEFLQVSFQAASFGT